MTREELEFSISQYLDGTLAGADRARLDELLATDSEARQVLAEFRSLETLVRANAPEPSVNWDRLAAHLSGAIAAADEPQSYKIAWYRNTSAMARAASLLLVIGLAIFLERTSRVRDPIRPLAVIQIQGPQAESAAGVAVATVSIGPASPADENRYQLSEGIVYRPSRVSLIASTAGDAVQQDSERSPYR